MTPFLKWAGGKQSLLPQILEHFPDDIETYYEPFLGAGSLFFAMPAGLPKVVSDYNSELVLTYETIRDNVDGVLDELRLRKNSKDDYLLVRSWDRGPEFASRSAESRAARFIYLNKCGFNGLYRVNKEGNYNVPYGHPKSVDFVMEPKLRAVSDFLKAKTKDGGMSTQISAGGYKEILADATGSGSFVYCDPPYFPTSGTANFVNYSSNGFGARDQEELHKELVRLTQEGVRILLSNSDTRFIRDLYSDGNFRVNEVQVRRAIAAKTSSRGKVTEVLIDNFEAAKR